MCFFSRSNFSRSYLCSEKGEYNDNFLLFSRSLERFSISQDNTISRKGCPFTFTEDECLELEVKVSDEYEGCFAPALYANLDSVWELDIPLSSKVHSPKRFNWKSALNKSFQGKDLNESFVLSPPTQL